LAGNFIGTLNSFFEKIITKKCEKNVVGACGEKEQNLFNLLEYSKNLYVYTSSCFFSKPTRACCCFLKRGARQARQK
jgi:hypothetical protein